MDEPQSKIGNQSQSFESPFEGIKTELHTIVDKLQLDEPSEEPPRRPLWQRVLWWQIPIGLVAFLIILAYNSSTDSCNGVKITYRTQTLCIANDNDFFLFVEHLACDVIDKGNVMADSLTMDAMATQTIQNYFTKYNFSLEIQPTEAEVLRGMRNAGYDSTSFSKNVAVAFWNAGVRYLGVGKTDSACLYFNKLEKWAWADSVLTAADRVVITQNCFNDLPNANPAVIPPKNVPQPKNKVIPPPKKQPPTNVRTPPKTDAKQPLPPSAINPLLQPPEINLIDGGIAINPNIQSQAPPSTQATQAPIVQTTTDYINKVAFNMVKVKGGTFQMGSNDKEAQNDEKPVHRVTLSDFSIGATEVTQAQWKAVMGYDNNPSYYKGDDLPVEQVSWDDIQDFLMKINSFSKTQYRLPTEAEWEYAARGGNASKGHKYSGSNNIDEVAWYDNNSNRKTHTVGSKKANELGIYDMSGNVWEWCSDFYDENYYKNSPAQNPKGAAKSESRSLRGGSWGYSVSYCRVSVRDRVNPNVRFNFNGFRVVWVSQDK